MGQLRHRVLSRVTRARDGGFTLIEAVVALGVATIMFTALAYSAVAAVRSTQIARANQQAIDLANDQLEALRQLPWGELEQLVRADSSPSLTETIASQESNNISYSVNSFVTTPATSTGELQLRVVVTWDDYGEARQRVAETSVSNKTSGLPIPDFEIAATTPDRITVTPGSAAVWGFRLVNRGAWDNWTLSATPTGLTFYADRTSIADPTPDGQFDSDVDQPISETGLIDPYESLNFWVVANQTDTQGTFTWQGSAASLTQPEATSGTQSWSMTLDVADATPPPTPGQVCPDTAVSGDPAAVNGYSVVSYYLHNSGKVPWPPAGASNPVSGTDATNPLDLTTNDGALPSDWTLPPYSMDVAPTTPGRVIQPGASTTLPAQNAQFQMLRDRVWYTGTARLRLFVRNLNAGSPAEITVELIRVTVSGSSASYAMLHSSGAVEVTSCDSGAGYREVVVDFPFTSVLKLSKNAYLGFRVLNSGTQDVSLAYDQDGYPARITVVEK